MLQIDERRGSGTHFDIDPIDFGLMVDRKNLLEMQMRGGCFIWSNGAMGLSRQESRIDMALMNTS